MPHYRLCVAFLGPNGIPDKIPTISSNMYMRIQYIIYVFDIYDSCNNIVLLNILH